MAVYICITPARHIYNVRHRETTAVSDRRVVLDMMMVLMVAIGWKRGETWWVYVACSSRKAPVPQYYVHSCLKVLWAIYTRKMVTLRWNIIKLLYRVHNTIWEPKYGVVEGLRTLFRSAQCWHWFGCFVG